jgi:HEAT repeat protein
MRVRSRGVVAPGLAGSFVCLLSGLVAAGPVNVARQDDQVSFRATDAPLGTVLAAIGEECEIDIRSEAALDEPVTVTLGPMPLAAALRRLLRDHSYILQSDLAGGEVQSIWILAPAGAVDAESAGWSSGRDAAIDAMVLDLSNPDPDVREEAVLSLGNIGGASVVPFLLQSLADSSADVREAAEAVLDDIDQNSQSTPTAGTNGSQ